jgi:hypothetical protein
MLLIGAPTPVAAEGTAPVPAPEPLQLDHVGASPTTSVIATNPKRASLHPACVAYDLHILTLIEDHGLVEDTEPEVLRDAAFTMLEARVACRAGDVRGALALYDHIPLDHVPMTPFYRILMR